MRDIARKAIGAAAAIFDADGRILLVKHTYGMLNWELPGGFAEVDESPTETAVREVLEETGLAVTPVRMIGVYYEPSGRGIGGEMIHFVFLCQPTDPTQGPGAGSGEISECAFWRTDDLPRPINDFTARRIADAQGESLRLPVVVPPRTWLT